MNKLILKFLIILQTALVSLPLGADERDYQQARSILGVRSPRLVQINDASHEELQGHFRRLYAKLKSPDFGGGEDLKVFLVAPSPIESYLAFVIPEFPDVVFWNPWFFLDNDLEDIDLYVLAHELRHLTRQNRSLKDTRSKEYDADGVAVAKGLFRVGYRVGKDPEPAIVHPETLIKFLKKIGDGYREDYLNGNMSATAVKILYANQRGKRKIPAKPVKRQVSDELYQDIRDTLEQMGGVSESDSKEDKDTPTEKKIKSAYNRITGNPVDALMDIDDRRREWNPSPSAALPFEMVAEFAGTFDQIEKALCGESYDWSGQQDLKARVFAARAFERFSRFPHGFHGPWSKSLHDGNYDKMTATGIHPFYLKYNSVRADKGLQILQVDQLGLDLVHKVFENPGVEADPRTTVFLTSRLIYQLVESEKVDLKRRPLFSFYLGMFLALAERDLAGVATPPVLKKFYRIYGQELQEVIASEGFSEMVAEHLFLMDGKVLTNVSGFILEQRFDRIFPGLKEKLKEDARLMQNIVLRVVLESDGKEAAQTYFRKLLRNQDYESALGALYELYRADHSFFSENNMDVVLEDIFKTLAGDSKNKLSAYIPGLEKGVEAYVSGRLSGVFEAKKKQGATEALSKLRKLKQNNEYVRAASQWITQWILRSPVEFIKAWMKELAYVETPLFMLADWRQILVGLNLKELMELQDYGRSMFRTSSPFATEFLVSYQSRLAKLLEQKTEKLTKEELDLVVNTLNYSPSSSPYSQKLMKILMDSISGFNSAEEAKTTLKILVDIFPSHFPDSQTVVALFARAFVRFHSEQEAEFSAVPLKDLIGSLDFVRDRFRDPSLGQQILNRLAVLYKAQPTQKAEFRYSTDGREEDVENVIEGFHIWNELFIRLDDSKTLALIDFLRGAGSLTRELKLELSLQLLKTGIFITEGEVESYLNRRFRDLSPFHRASVFQMALDGTTSLLDDQEYRTQVFYQILDAVADPQVKKVFLDLWEAGMRALPQAIRSLVLSIVLSESGSTGSPEQALVTLFSNMGPLEQKFGQALAFANLPESYRQELRKLWDSAQELGWWEAWELLEVQHGDIRAAGYTLSRVLHSGSTEAFLEIVHEQTGRRFAVPVFRDGIVQGVNVGAHQLRVFAQTLAEKDKRNYGFLPLLVEDSIRTMRMEIHAPHKREMTETMAEKYRQAALKLGGQVDGNGYIQLDGIQFAHIPFSEIQLPDGKVLYVQELAEGVPLRQLEQSNNEQYKSLTETLLKLEFQVRSDPTAPMDKDRMPGQNIFNEEYLLNYILDHGQAQMVAPEIHQLSWEFVRDSMADRGKAMAVILKELTGWAPEDKELKSILGFVKTVDHELKALTFLSEVSEYYLKRPDGDKVKETFFELLHGVRTTLRLLQWETSEGVQVGAEELRGEIQREMSIGSKIVYAWNGVWDFLTSKLRTRRPVSPITKETMAAQMEQAYQIEEVPFDPDYNCLELISGSVELDSNQ